MAMASASRAALWRYNYKILVGTGYWILVLPIAASQIVTLWMMALSHDFNQTVGTRIAECMTPILSAFLVSHAMAPEYRSGIGNVLACKPVSLWRLLTVRVGLAMGLAFALTVITLVVCSLGLAPINLGPPLLAAIPSLWFLSLAALALSTLFRSAMAGFAATAAVWALDLGLGFGVHPLLSLQGLYAKLDAVPVSETWPIGKAVLVAAGLLLLALNARLISRLGRSADRADLTRVAGTVLAILAIYVVTGAAVTVGYAYTKRGRLGSREAVWLRRQMGLYGPVPVARMFGPAFAAYVSEPPARAEESAKPARVGQLEAALERWPNSAWGPSIAYELASTKEAMDIQSGIEAYLSLADRYPDSLYAPRGLANIVLLEDSSTPEEARIEAARRLIRRFSHSEETEKAAALLQRYYPDVVKADELLQAALAAGRSGTAPLRPQWLATAARLQLELGRREEAAKTAQQALELAEEYRKRDMAEGSSMSSLARYRGSFATALQQAQEVLQKTR